MNKYYYACGIICSLMFFSCVRTEKFALVTPTFSNITQEANLADTTITFSAAAADWNQDNYPDLVVSTHGNVLYFQNDKNGRFEEVIHVGGNDIRDTHGVSFIDINNDGLVDLGVSKGAERGKGQGSNEFYLNTKGTFTQLEHLDSLIVDPLGRGRAIIPYDLNLDGNPDLMIMNFFQKNRPHHFAISNAKSPASYTDAYLDSGLNPFRATSILPLNINNTEDELFFAQGNGYDAGKVFKKVVEDGVIRFIDAGSELGLENDVFTRKIIPIDYDSDGDLDLLYIRSFKEYTGSYVEDNRIYFKYDGGRYNKLIVGFSVPFSTGEKFSLDARFNEWPNPKWLFVGKKKQKVDKIPFTLRLDDPMLKGAPAIDKESDLGMFLWVNDDKKLMVEVIGAQGKLEAFTGFIQLDGAIEPNTVTDIGLDTTSRVRMNKLFKNEQGTFIDVTAQAGVGGMGRAYDVVPADFNNDSHLDLYIVNGGDYFDNVPNQLLLNRGDGTFIDAANLAGVEGSKLGKGNGVIAFDFDLDGDIDIFLYNGAGTWPKNEGPFELFRNELPASKNFISINLKGELSNARGWGSRVVAKIGKRTVIQQKYPANGCLSTSDLPIHLGLGSKKKANQIIVYWPSGKVTRLKNVSAGSVLDISETTAE
ncbi:MAG: CRTAC1 family protein [Saprospiraceae bacterium]